MDGSFGIKKTVINSIFLFCSLFSCSLKEDKKNTLEVSYKYFDEFSLEGKEKLMNIDDYEGNFYRVIKTKDTIKSVLFNRKKSVSQKLDSVLFLNKGKYWYCIHKLPLVGSEKSFQSFSKIDVKYILKDSIIVWSRDYFNRGFVGKYAGQSVQLITRKDTISKTFDSDIELKDGEERLYILKKIIIPVAPDYYDISK